MGRLTSNLLPKSKHITFYYGVAFTRANVKELSINCDMNLSDDCATMLKKKIARI